MPRHSAPVEPVELPGESGSLAELQAQALPELAQNFAELIRDLLASGQLHQVQGQIITPNRPEK